MSVASPSARKGASTNVGSRVDMESVSATDPG